MYQKESIVNPCSGFRIYSTPELHVIYRTGVGTVLFKPKWPSSSLVIRYIKYVPTCWMRRILTMSSLSMKQTIKLQQQYTLSKMKCVSPCSKLLWSGVPVAPPPPPAITPPAVSLGSSLRFKLSFDPKRTRTPERELMSGEVSDSPGRSSALVGVTVKRTDAIATCLEKVKGDGVVDWGGGGGL